MKLSRIELTELDLGADEQLIEAPCKLDPTEIALQQSGTQKIRHTLLIGKKNTTPCTIITLKNSKQIAVKESFAQIEELIANA